MITLLGILLLFFPIPIYAWWFFKNRSAWSRAKRSMFKWVGYGLLAVNFFALAFLSTNWREDIADGGRLMVHNEQKQLAESRAIALSLLDELRAQGIDDSLIATALPSDQGMLFIRVTHDWMALPANDQLQNRKIIELTLKKLHPPQGYPFALQDWTGKNI